MQNESQVAVTSPAQNQSAIMDFYTKDHYARMSEMAQTFHASGCFQKSIANHHQAIAIMQAGFEIGLPPMESLRSFYIVGGGIQMYGPAMLKRLRLDGWRVEYTDNENPTEKCTATVSRGGESYSYTATKEEMQSMKSQAYIKAPVDKLRYHAIRMIIKHNIPEAGSGISVYVDNEETVDSYSQSNPAPSMKVLESVEKYIDKVNATESLDELQAIIETAPSFSDLDATKFRTAIIAKKTELKKSEVVEVTDDVEPAKPEKENPAKFWTEQKLTEVVTNTPDPTHLTTLKDTINKLQSNGEITNHIWSFAIDLIQRRHNELTIEARNELEKAESNQSTL